MKKNSFNHTVFCLSWLLLGSALTNIYFGWHRLPELERNCQQRLEVARAKSVMLRIQCNKKNPNEYYINKNNITCANVY